MITTVVISKDKPAQLHLLLESLYKYGGNLFDIHVLYEATSTVIEEGYLKTKLAFYNKSKFGLNFPVRWYTRKNDNLCEDILSLLEEPRYLSCLFNDENILFDRVSSYKTIKELFLEFSLASLSLRLGNNTVIQNPYDAQNYFAELPEEGRFVMDRFLVWNAAQIKPFTNFGMPISINGHIYTSNLLKKVLERSKTEDRDTFETDIQKSLYIGNFLGNMPPLMACTAYSCVINNSATKISDDQTNDLGISDIELNERYINGKIIDFNFFNFTHVSKPFQDFIVRFKNENYMYNGG